MYERAELEKRYGTVWDSHELQLDYTVLQFQAPYVIARRKSDATVGTLRFQHSPRLYFDFVPDPEISYGK